jgi:hypothetical protein
MKLPTFQELHYDADLAFKNDEFKSLLNKQPPESWTKKNAMANNAKYLPIDKIEFLLDSIFQDWKIEVLREGAIFNSVYVTVRVHYLHPIINEWRFHDGIGAKDLQVDSGTKLSIQTIKSAAVQMALPSAKSYAIKDACDHLGKLFGRDLNRKDSLDFVGAYGKPSPPEDQSQERILLLINSIKTVQGLEKLLKDCNNNISRTAYDLKLKDLKNEPK